MNKILLLLAAVIIMPVVTISGCAEKEPVKQKALLYRYTVLFSITLFDTNERFGEVLIPYFSRQTPYDMRIDAIKYVIEQKGFQYVILYCTTDAYKAMMSRKYLEAHPDALRIGYLGEWRYGRFTPGEELYPDF